MTALSRPVTRETAKRIGSRPILVTIAPLGSQEEARIGFRLKGRRTQYVILVSDAYRMAALWFGQKEAAARKAARRMGVPWKQARKAFIRENSI